MTQQHIFLLMPEWQGSAAARAMLLTEGAGHLRGDLPATARHEVPVPVHAGDALGTPVARLSSVLAARDAAREILAEHEVPAITVGGDCASTLAGLEHAVQRAAAHDETLAVLWFDAHPDLQHPSTSPSGAASGMTLRHALGDGTDDLVLGTPIDPTRVALIGTREIDAEEAEAIAEFAVHALEVAEAEVIAESVRSWLASTGATRLYVHVDLDVLDPSEFSSVHVPVPFGLTTTALTTAIRAAVSEVPLAGAAICEFAPADEQMASDDAPTVLRILAALTSGSTV